MTKCRKCGAEIEFVRMKSDKYMPVDPGKKPVRLGGSEIYITPDGETLRGHKPLAGEPTDDYLSKNCPNCGAPIDPSSDKCPYCGTLYDVPLHPGFCRPAVNECEFSDFTIAALAALTPNEHRALHGLPPIKKGEK